MSYYHTLQISHFPDHTDAKSVSKAIQDLALQATHLEISAYFPVPVELNIDAPNCRLMFKNCRNVENVRFEKMNVQGIVFNSEFSNPSYSLKGHFDLFDFVFDNRCKGLENLIVECGTQGRIQNLSIIIPQPLKNLQLTKTKIDTLNLSTQTKECEVSEVIFGSITGLLQNCALINFEKCVVHTHFVADRTTGTEARLVDVVFKSGALFSSCDFSRLELKNCQSEADSHINISSSSFSHSLSVINANTKLLVMSSVSSPNVFISECHYDNDLSISGLSDINSLKIENCNFASLLIPNQSGRRDDGRDTRTKYVVLSNLRVNFLSLRSSRFKEDFRISKSTIEIFDATGSEFGGPTQFHEVTFKQAPKFFNSKLFEDTDFMGCRFDVSNKNAIARFQKLKHLMKGIENERDENIFAALETKAHSYGLTWRRDFPLKFLSKIYEYTNDFGADVIRPLYILIGIAILGMAPLYFLGGVAYTPPLSSHPYFDTWYQDVEFITSFEHLLLSSIFNTLGPIRLLTSLNIFTPITFWGAVFTWLQIVCSSFLWYLVIVGIRKHFRSN